MTEEQPPDEPPTRTGPASTTPEQQNNTPGADGELSHLIDRYCSAWNETDDQRRAAILSDIWVPDGLYEDPKVSTVGPDALSDHIGSVQQNRPGAVATRTGPVDAHHNVGRFPFDIRSSTGEQLMEGVDFFEVDTSQHRLVRITGFVNTTQNNPPATKPGRSNITSGDPFESVYGYCRAVRVGDHIHVSGTTAQDPFVIGCDSYVQAKNALSIIGKALTDAGAAMTDVVRTVTYVTDMGNSAMVARAHSESFDQIRPAATIVEVAALDEPSRTVEIEAYAICSPDLGEPC